MLPEDIEPNTFAAIMRQLGLSNRRARIVLENRISLSAVKHWRAGRAKPPHWVFQILGHKLAAIESIASKLRKASENAAGPGKGNHDARAYHLHRLAQKEKAGD